MAFTLLLRLTANSFLLAPGDPHGLLRCISCTCKQPLQAAVASMSKSQFALAFSQRWPLPYPRETKACDIGASLIPMEFITESWCGDWAGYGHKLGNQKINLGAKE